MNFILVVNEVYGEGSRPLKVTAILIDGSELDATGPPYGTTYDSDDLAVASFGLDAGRVYGGEAGVTTVHAENGAFRTDVTVEVQVFAPTSLAKVGIAGCANAVDVEGGRLYVASSRPALIVYDIANPATPIRRSTLWLGGSSLDVDVVGAYAYLAMHDQGLAIVDISNPLLPALVGQVGTPGPAWGVVARPPWVFLADDRGLVVVDASDVAHPAVRAAIETAGFAQRLDLEGDLLALAAGRGGVQLFDVGDPQNPQELGTATTRPGGNSSSAGVAIRGGRAYSAEGSEGLGGLAMLQIAEPLLPSLISRSSDAFGLSAVEIDGSVAVAADFYFVNAIPFFDISGPTPIFRSALSFSGDANGHDLELRDGLVYEVAGSAHNRRVGTCVGGRLQIGQYAQRVGEAPPTVAIVEPTTLEARATDDVGQVASSAPRVIQVTPDPPPSLTFSLPAAGIKGLVEAFSGGLMQVKLVAFDNRGLQSVELKVAGISAGQLPAPPFEWIVTLPGGPSTLDLEATAFDVLGKSASTALTVHLLPTTMTGVTGQVLDSLGNPQVGATVRCSGVTTTTTVGGAFTLPAVPTTGLGVMCNAVVNGLPSWVGASGLVPFTPGTTDVGPVVVGATMAVSGSGSPFGADFSANTYASDENLTTLIPWLGALGSSPTGFAFAADGSLWQAETDSVGGRSFSYSSLSRRDVVTREILQGPFDVYVDSEEVALIDLALDLGTEHLYGLDHDFFTGGHRLLSIDSDSGAATLVGELPAYFSAGLDFDGAGHLWIVSENGGAWQLHQVDPQTGNVLLSSSLAKSGTVAGVSWSPVDDHLLVASEDSFYAVTPGSSSVTLWSSPAINLGSSQLTSLAIRRTAGASATTTLTGKVVDDFGEPVEGAVVSVPGRWVLSESDGTFTLADVTPRAARILVAVFAGSEYAYSEALVPTLGGITDVGVIGVALGGGGG